ncbi:MAG: hypothetical protein CMJ78_06715 [Planctomycetaceae bacterium]|nr:hypothetical protein [Planctomycetaceae bacterium]
MSDFDAYHKWLGIPPSQQPPTHYRLLGVDLFESDAEVIDVAANQRMSYLQDVAAGLHVELSQKLLNEISSARRCLLNADEKAAYDEKLRAEIDAASEASDAAPSPFDFSESPELTPEPKATRKKPAKSDDSEDSESEEEAKPKGLPVVWIGTGVVSVISIIIAIFMLLTGPSEDPDDGLAILQVKWNVNERDGAFVMKDAEVLINGAEQLPSDEVVKFKVRRGEHTFIFERSGYREIKNTWKFLEGETISVELNWRAKR